MYRATSKDSVELVSPALSCNTLFNDLVFLHMLNMLEVTQIDKFLYHD